MGSRRTRKAQILEAAERLLARYGPAKTTIADIAREAQVGVGTVYLEFGSKDDIVSALSQERHDVVLSAMRRAASGEGAFGERFTAVFVARIEALHGLAAEGHHACDLVLCSSSAVQGAHRTYREAEARLVADLLRTAIEGGDCAPLDVDETAEAVLRAFATFSPPHLFNEPRPRAKEGVLRLSRLLVEGLRPRDAPKAAARKPAVARHR